jgi:hypothetical protein
MGNHCGAAAHSCSSFADLIIKSIQRFEEKLALNRWIFFMTRWAKLEQLWAAPPMIAHLALNRWIFFRTRSAILEQL